MSAGAATVLVVEDDPQLREALADTLRLAGHQVCEAADGQAGLELLERAGVDLVVTDVQMRPMGGMALLEQLRARRPELPVLMMTAYGTIDGAVAAMRAGAVDYIPKPFDARSLLERVGRSLQAMPERADAGLVAVAPASVEMAALARRVAASEVTVLLTGESGTGKEVLARYVHAHSARSAGPFVAINCAAIPESMLEATLFGYEKGAFTGAHKAAPGKFEQAQGGSLLLDEVSEMDLALQAKLLRVLQEREVERLGGRETLKLDVRVIATSNRELRAEVAAGRFREDLYYRLNVFPLHLAPLRERIEDVVPLARHILARRAEDAVPRLSAEAEARLRAHPWPGNVRELDNALQRALILQQGGCIEPADLRFDSASSAVTPAPAEDMGADLRSREQDLILETLAGLDGNRQETARRLGISPRTLRYKLARLREAGVTIPGDAASA